MSNRLLDRITIDPAIRHGTPCIRGLRYPVEFLLALLSSGMPHAEILADYDDLAKADIVSCAGLCDSPEPGQQRAEASLMKFLVNTQAKSPTRPVFSPLPDCDIPRQHGQASTVYANPDHFCAAMNKLHQLNPSSWPLPA